MLLQGTKCGIDNHQHSLCEPFEPVYWKRSGAPVWIHPLLKEQVYRSKWYSIPEDFLCHFPNPQCKAKRLNDHLVSVFTKEDKTTIHSLLHSTHPDMPSFEVAKCGVIKLLYGMNLYPKEFLGLGDISLFVLKDICAQSADILTYISNQ